MNALMHFLRTSGQGRTQKKGKNKNEAESLTPQTNPHRPKNYDTFYVLNGFLGTWLGKSSLLAIVYIYDFIYLLGVYDI